MLSKAVDGSLYRKELNQTCYNSRTQLNRFLGLGESVPELVFQSTGLEVIH